jgi:hypothetical protein
MATDKLFKVFGISNLNGEYKVRFANDMLRSKVLTKSGHTDIELVELSEAMTKYEGIKVIASLPEFANAHAQSAIAEYLDEKAPKTAVKAKAAPVKAAVKAKAVKATAKVTEDEDAPF